MEIGSGGRGCLAFDSLVLLELAFPGLSNQKWRAVPSLGLPSWLWVLWCWRFGGGEVTVVMCTNAWDS